MSTVFSVPSQRQCTYLFLCSFNFNLWSAGTSKSIIRRFFFCFVLFWQNGWRKSLTAILNKSWRQHSPKPQLYGHLTPITKTIKVRRTRHAGHCWRSRDELVNDVLLCTPLYGRTKARRLARIYIQQLCEDTGCSPEDLPEAMNDWEEWRERVRDIRAGGTTWWWWLWHYYYYL